MTWPETRLSLVGRLHDPHDADAWGSFLTDYEPFLLGMLRRRGFQEADARDVTQQVLLSVARHVVDWKPDGRPASFRRWLMTIARNTSLRALEQAARRPLAGEASSGAFERLPARTSPEDDYREEVMAWALSRIQHEFRPKTWSAFWESVVRQRPVEEVCRELQITAGALYMARSRVMARLKIAVTELDPGLDP